MAVTADPLWPGASTFPGTGVYSGQGVYPFYRCYLSTDDYRTNAPQFSDVSADLRSFNTSRGRNSEFDHFSAGSATIVLSNRTRSYDPTVQFAIRPMNRLRLYVEFSGETHDIFNGYAERWQMDYPGGGWSDATATVSCADEFKLLNLATLPTSGTIGPATVGPIIDVFLTYIRSQAPRRIQTGGTVASGADAPVVTYTGQSVLSAIDDAVRSDLAFTGGVYYMDQAFFAAADGTVTYLEADYRTLSPYNGVQATFGDAGGSELSYLDLVSDYSDSFLSNQTVVTNRDASTDVSTYTPSTVQYGTRATSFSVITNNNAFTYAAAWNVKRAYPMVKIISLKPNMGDTNAALAVFQRELMDRIRVLRTPPGGGARFDQEVFIQKIDYSVSGAGVFPDVTLGVSPL